MQAYDPTEAGFYWSTTPSGAELEVRNFVLNGWFECDSLWFYTRHDFVAVSPRLQPPESS